MNNCQKDNKTYKKALEKIKNDECYKPNCCLVGPTGPRGEADTITIRNTITSMPGEEARVIDNGFSGNHILDFIIPQGPMGPTGTGISILGSYDSYDELLKEHPTGNIGDSYLVLDDLYVWSDNNKKWQNAGTVRGPAGLQGPTGPKGDIGPTGPSGVTNTRSSYIVTFNNGTDVDGIKVESNERLPIDRLELDISNLITLDSKNKTINFNEIGYYKITFTVSAYPAVNDIDFDPTKDIVSVGFKEIDTDNAYVGVGQWVYNAEPVQLLGQGIITITNKDVSYELVNLGKYPIYLLTPDIAYIASKSYFSNSLVTMVIEYLGRQGA